MFTNGTNFDSVVVGLVSVQAGAGEMSMSSLTFLPFPLSSAEEPFFSASMYCVMLWRKGIE